jgi:hypothetical protein
MERISVSKKIRFEVFKRDGFKCQYCGRTIDEVKLEIDHINPVAVGGDNDIINLITSCFDCNSGKSDRLLSDNAALTKQRKQLELLQERRENLKLMLEWKNELLKQDEEMIQEVADFFTKRAVGYSPNEVDISTLRLLVKKFGFKEVVDAIEVSIIKYIEFKDNKVIPESVQLAFNKIGGICKIKREEIKNPGISDIYYIRGIVRNRLKNDYNYDDDKVLWLLKDAYKHKATIESMKEFTKKITSWKEFKDEINFFIENQKMTSEDTDYDDLPLEK